MVAKTADKRKVFEEYLIPLIEKIKHKKKTVDEIKKQLAEYDISYGKVQMLLNDPETEFEELDIRLLILFGEQIYLKTGDLSINPEDYFTESEIKEARQYSGELEINKFELPATFPNATVVGNSAFMVTMNVQTINEMLGDVLYYDFNLQREAKIAKRKDKVIIEPTLNHKNVKEITQHLLNGTLVPTVLVFNAQTRTSDSGTELVYDPKKLELTVTKGTRIAIVDGYHRCKAIQNALAINPDIQFNFAVLFTNYSTKKAQQYQAQLAKATPISKTRIQELEANRLSDTVVQQLREQSELKGRISQTNRVHTVANELVSYNVLADSIDEEFEMNTKVEALDVADYLTEYFDFLIGSYIEEFNNPSKDSIMSSNMMFIGYIVLARRMFEAKKPVKDLRKVLKKIDFNRNNELWKEYGVLSDKGTFDRDTNKIKKGIKDIFNHIDI